MQNTSVNAVGLEERRSILKAVAGACVRLLPAGSVGVCGDGSTQAVRWTVSIT